MLRHFTPRNDRRNLLIFLFGNNIVESRNKLSEIIEENKTIGKTYYVGSVNDFATFEEIIKSENLFSDTKIVIFENFFKGRAPKWKTELEFKNLESEENVYIFWEDGELNAAGKKAASLANRKNAFEFKIPNLLWNFLDGMKPVNVGTTLELSLQLKNINDILHTIDPNYLFLMIVRQFRLLLLSKEKYNDYPSDYKRLTFQKYKLAKQVSFFTEEKLREIYKNLLDIEERQKTGASIYNLKTEIEKFLLLL